MQESDEARDANWVLSFWASSPFCIKKSVDVEDGEASSETARTILVGAALIAGDAVRARATRKKVLKDMTRKRKY